MTSGSRTAEIIEYLEREGYRPWVDDDGDIAFKKEGGSFFVQLDDSDAEYYRILYPHFWAVEDDEQRMQALDAANYANVTTKVAKVIIVGQQVAAVVELRAAEPAGFEKVFESTMAAIPHAARQFATRLEELTPAEA